MFRFRLDKALQAAAVLLRDEPSRVMGRMRLIKLLYIAERESLRETGAPIIGDEVYAMKNGPVLSTVYNLIKGEAIDAAVWHEHFQNDGYLVRMVSDPGTGLLSEFEIESLQETKEKYCSTEDYDLALETHEFAEWKKHDPGESSRRIPHEDILAAVGHDKEKVEEIRKEAETEAFFAGLLGS